MTNKTNKKGIKKQFKYELIELIISTIFNFDCIISHIQRNGFELNKFIIELFVSFTFTFMFYYIIKDIRKNPQNWNLKQICQ